jgi:hypothetical protein
MAQLSDGRFQANTGLVDIQIPTVFFKNLPKNADVHWLSSIVYLIPILIMYNIL